MNTFEEITNFLEYLGDAILMVNEGSEIVFANQACADMFGYEAKAMRDLSIGNLIEKSNPLVLKHPGLVEKFIQSNAPARAMLTRASMPCINASGEAFNARISIAHVTIDDKLFGFATIQDFTSLQKEIENLEISSHQDTLTGLYNRRYLEHITGPSSRVLAAWSEIGVIYIDLDKFKPVNDRYGHDVGDAVLKVVAKKIKGCVRFDDIVFRMGGDEFLVLLNLHGISNKHYTLNAISEKIHHDVIQPIRTDNYIITIGMSAGCGLYPENAEKLVDLINAADRAMYAAKKSDNFVAFVK